MLARPRLFRLLDRSRGAPLLWIAAPPGAGKTTLVSHYLEQRSRKHVWYQVDAGDRDVAGLLSYLALAVEAPGRRKSTPRLPRYGAEYFASLEDLYRSFFRGLFARLGEPATLVFDDYHELAEDAEFHRAVCAALEQMPEGHQVVVLSRHPAPAAFARMRAEQRMTSLDADALKLTQDETRRLARVLRDKAAASSGSQRLHAQCEGWVTGFMLLLDR
ncbi:MAG TPA: AAA family ATPase, partial [Gammaproteobacteria bacterium]|nr:AAA family ATPase [Gammaproteobacteria bacterium]